MSKNLNSSEIKPENDIETNININNDNSSVIEMIRNFKQGMVNDLDKVRKRKLKQEKGLELSKK